MRRRILLAVLSAAIAGGSLVALQHEAHAQTAAELVAARALFAEGVELEKKKDYAGALEKFRKVGAIKSTAIVRYHEGFCAEKLGRWIEALDAYAKATIEGQGDPKQKNAVDAARKADAALRPRVPRIRAKVTGTQKGKWEIRIDGTPISAALLDTPVPVDVGKHLVELSGEGIAPAAQEITVGEKETREVSFEAKEASAVAPPVSAPDKGAEKPADAPKPAPPEPAKAKPKEPAKPSPRPEAPRLALVIGLGLGNIVPGGQIVDPATINLPNFARAGNSDQLEYYGSGVALEPRVGLRFLRPLTAYAFWQHGFLGKSGHSQDSSDFRAATDAIGLGASLLTHPNGAFGGYADVSVARRTTVYDDRSGGEKASFTGNELGLKLGAAYKPTPTITLLAFGWLSLGSYGSFTYEVVADPSKNRDEEIDKTASFSFLGLGVGATYDLALGKQ
ncbi:MAG: hypothetical protein HYV09_17420 [Deltaproteobacteria bacterium]|nr:hypothetical protein [Deltaproteobacteria bacterium]